MYSRIFVAVAAATSLSLALVPAPAALATVSDTASATIATTADPANQYQADLATWKQELADAEQAVADADAALAAAQSEAQQQQAKADAAQADLDAATTRYEQAKADLANLDVTALERAEQEAKDALAAAEAAAAAAAQSVKDAAAAEVKANERLAEATRQRDAQAGTLAERERTRDEAEDELFSVGAELDDLERRDISGSDYSAQDWKRLASQSIEEMINEYREAHGLHPLTVHPVFTEQAEAWSEVMARDYDESGDLDAAFRHSNGKEWGRSGENIIFTYQPQRGEDVNAWTRQTWESVPYYLFDGWRHSPGHNRNMLAPQMQRMGVGIATDSKGGIFGTTMFFIEDTHSDDSYYRTDAMTRKALESGEPFYLPAGATDLMRAEPLRNPELNPGEEPEYGDFILDGLDKSEYTDAGLDPSVEPVDHTEAIESFTQQYIALEHRSTEAAEEAAAASAELDRLTGQLDEAKAAHEDATAAREKAEKAEVDANVDVVSTNSRLTAASSELERKRAIPREPYEQSLADATVTLNHAKSTFEAERAAAAELSDAQGPARNAVESARAALAQVRAREPQPPAPAPAPTSQDVTPAETTTAATPAETTTAATPAETTTAAMPAETTTAAMPAETTTAADAPAETEGSSTAGTAIAVVASLLAILAAGIAFAPQLGIDLSQFGIQLP
ncbi:CAP domain-containing protein [Corynebacterium godavarianum]|uniref:CAP domain-containing protein n=1 Tax=Corynebacterium godavarianum TaxID=2054421 RepID=UPI00142ED920|nr:CAP domain-containing protein [Corynebacterium godavarianum]MBL7286411.1 CAP domain-containing protein [Corynebacterium godavarianum]